MRLESGRWIRTGGEMGYPAPAAQALLVDSAGYLWVATDGFDFHLSRNHVLRNTVLTLAPGARHFSPTGLAVGQVWSMAQPSDGTAWIADTSNGAITRLGGRTVVAAKPTTIAMGAETQCLLFDSNQSVFVGLVGGGLRRIRDLAQPKNQPLDEFRTSDDLSGGMVFTTLLDREGNVWFGTSGGLDRFRESKVFPFSAREGLNQVDQIGLTADGRGNLWLYNSSLDIVRRFDGQQFSLFRIPAGRGVQPNGILSIYAAHDNEIWVAGATEIQRGQWKVHRLPVISRCRRS